MLQVFRLVFFIHIYLYYISPKIVSSPASLLERFWKSLPFFLCISWNITFSDSLRYGVKILPSLHSFPQPSAQLFPFLPFLFVKSCNLRATRVFGTLSYCVHLVLGGIFFLQVRPMYCNHLNMASICLKNVLGLEVQWQKITRTELGWMRAVMLIIIFRRKLQHVNTHISRSKIVWITCLFLAFKIQPMSLQVISIP